MKRSFVVFLLFLFTLLHLLSCSKNNVGDQKELESIDLNNINRAELPYRLKIVRTFSATVNMLPGDINGDGVDELISILQNEPTKEQPATFEAFSLEPGIVLFCKTFQFPLRNLSIIDIDEDGKQEIIFNELKPDTAIVHICNELGEAIHSFIGATNPKVNKDDPWVCGLDIFNLMDIDGDGYKDILFSVKTTYAYQPRGVYAYSFCKKDFIWKYEIGFVPNSAVLFDVGEDGKREILLGSSSPENCDSIVVNDTDDLHVYLTILDSLNEKPKSIKMGGVFSDIVLNPHDVDNDGETEIFITYNSKTLPHKESYLAQWIPGTGKTEPRIQREGFLCPHLAFFDANNDNNDDIFICWNDGTIECRNHQLNLLWSRNFINFVPTNLAALDLNSDGKMELAVTGQFEGAGKLIILNEILEIITLIDRQYCFDANGYVVDPGFGEKKIFLAKSNFQNALVQMVNQYPVLITFSLHWLIIGLLLGIIAAGAYAGRNFPKRHQEKLTKTFHSLISSVQEGIMVLDAKGKIISINHQMENLLHIVESNIIGLFYKKLFVDLNLNDLKEMLESSFFKSLPMIEKEINFNCNGKSLTVLVEIVPFSLKDEKQPGRLIILRDITEIVQSKRTIAWATMAQKLAHEIKTPLSTVMLSAQRLQMEYEQKPKEMKKVEKYLNNITGQVDRLRKVTDAFMKFVKMEKIKLEPIHINQLLSNCLEDTQQKMSNEIKIKKELATDIPTFKADGQQLSIALNNIFDNSLNAMKDKGTITVTTRLVQSLQTQSETQLKNSIQIEIADTGIGIPKDHINQLFQPFFSKSPGGTGLGLVITKKIIEDHEGEIKVMSEVAIGTSVFVTLPV